MAKESKAVKHEACDETWIRVRPRCPNPNPKHEESKEPGEQNSSGVTKLAVVLTAVLCCWFFFETFHVTLSPFSIVRKNAEPARSAVVQSDSTESVLPDRNAFYNSVNEPTATLPAELRVVRIATWNLAPLDFEKVTDKKRGPAMADLISRFDLVAIQGIRARNKAVLDGLVYLLRDRGTRFGCLTATWSEQTAKGDGLAFLFNMDRIETDGDSLYEVSLPGAKNISPLLVGSFRTAEQEKDKSFTFCLINVQMDEEATPVQRDMLRDVYEEVRSRTGRFGLPEDDIILLGSLGSPVRGIGQLSRIPGLVAVHPDIPTLPDGRSVDNIIFHVKATSEYLERFGVIDLKKAFGLSAEEESRLSEHRPVWADFSVRETANRD